MRRKNFGYVGAYAVGPGHDWAMMERFDRSSRRTSTDIPFTAAGVLSDGGLNPRKSGAEDFGGNLGRCCNLTAMEIATLKSPPMSGEYYRQQAARVRGLAQEATMPALREHLADVALQYEKLAEGAEGGHRYPE
jgi:hypothetical protein